MAESVSSTSTAAVPPAPGDLDRARAQLAAIVEHSEDAIYAIDLDGRITAWNHGAELLYGFSANDVVGRQWDVIVPLELRGERDQVIEVLLGERSVMRYETVRMRADGTRVEVAITASAIRDQSGATTGVSAIARDITERRLDERRRQELLEAEQRARVTAERSRRKLAEAQERFRIAFEHAPIGIALISASPAGMGCFLEVNSALSEKLGHHGDQLLGRSFMDFAHPEDRGQYVEPIRALLDGEKEEVELETRYLRREGAEVWLQVRASAVRDHLGRPLYMVAHFRDVTEARRHEQELRFLADHDALTGLVNRRRFEEELDALLDAGRASGKPAAVLVIDLDNFKGVNDTYGHAVGDDLLRRVAVALRSRLRETDVVGRLGGDEFGVLLPGASSDQARTVAGEMLHAVDAEAAARVGDGRVRVTASVGINPIDPSAGQSAESMLVDADIAMYQAKEAGRNQLAVAGGDVRGNGRQQWSRRVQDALGGDGLELWEQPLLNLATGEHDRSELLVRLKGRQGEAIPAGVFLRIVERFGQAQAIDRWVVARAVRLLAERQAAGRHAGIEVNLSALSVTDEEVMDFIHSEVADGDVDPTAITFEVTETASVGDVERAGRLMNRLADLGCQFALDDFGAGFGSLYHLKHLPIDVIKVDGDFVQRLPHSRFDQLTVGAVVQIAKGSGKLTVAERVADDATIDLLRDYGVDYAQGFHIARPRRVERSQRFRTAA